jgi:hypothetical protein
MKPTAAHKRHYARIAMMGCLVCGGAATVHHVSGGGDGGRITRHNYLVAPLCAEHHQIQHGGADSVEALGHKGFKERYGIDLLEWAMHEAPAAFWADNARRLRDPVWRAASFKFAERKRNG